MERGMDVNSAKHGEKTAAAEYADQLEKLIELQAREQRRERLLGYAKLALAAATLIAAALLARHVEAMIFLLAPVAGFVVLAVMQDKLLGAIAYRRRAIHFYERGLARLNDRWTGNGESGDRFLDASHPYARDLDLFGSASLFQYLSTARTRSGEETLARWLLAAAPLDEIVARQTAIRELESRLKFREVWVASIVCWAVWGTPVFALLMSVLNFGYSHKLHARLESAAASLEQAAGDLRLLSEALALVERESLSTPKLSGLQAALKRDGMMPSAAIKKLARIVELFESRQSLFARPLDLVTFWSAQLVFRAEGWQREFGPAIRGWVAAVGEIEALTALSGFSYEHPEYVFPEFVRGGALFDAKGMAHPLLPTGKAVDNDVCLGDEMQLIILSGPNMAGKSTFIRSIGVNAVLAQCGAPVRARQLRLSPLTVAASICVLDSLSGGMSKFYAEIHRIKLIEDLTRGPAPVLFLMDELLSGTNSHDRLVGTQFILRTLLERHAIGIVSTHDLALTQIPERLGGRASNYHFEDRLEGNALVFDYKVKPGIVQTSNALKLMQSIGLGVPDIA